MSTANPVHIHGHHFQVVKIGWPTYNKSTNIFMENNADIGCKDGSVSCNVGGWRDPAWSGGRLPGMVERSPVIKDTVTVPVGGYVVVRFKANNPGELHEPAVLCPNCYYTMHATYTTLPTVPIISPVSSYVLLLR